jgi:hypothetical protein
MPRGKRHFFPDEEPELDYPQMDYGYAATGKLCSRCGSADHKYDPGKVECPNDPMTIRRVPG